MPVKQTVAAVLAIAVWSAAPVANATPFGIHVRTEALHPTDPAADQSVPGYEIRTPAGTVRTLPSLNQISVIAHGAEEPTILETGIPTRSPSGIAFSDAYVWVADTGNRRILRWDIREGIVEPGSATALETPPLLRPVGLASDGDRLFVADSWADQILVLDEDGNLERTIGQHGYQQGFLSGPVGLLLHDELLFVADSRNSRVQAFDPDSGDFVYEWGLHVIRPHEGAGRLHYPTKLLPSDDGEMIGVTEPWEDRVQWFRQAGQDETVAERLPLGADDFVHFGPGIDVYHRLFAITDPDTHTVRIFDLSLDTPVLIGVIGDFGNLPSQFRHPADVAFLPPAEGRPLRLAVADRGNAKIALYSIDWSPSEPLRFRPKLASLLRTLDLLALGADRAHPIDAVALVAAANDTVWVLDANNDRLIRLNNRLRGVANYDLSGDPTPRPARFASASLSGDGSVIALDTANARLVHLTGDKSASVQLDPAVELPASAHFRAGEILIVDKGLHSVVHCDASGNARTFIGRAGLKAGEFFKPAAIAELSDGRLLVVDRGNHRVQIFDADWTLAMVHGPRLYISEAQSGGRAVSSTTPPRQPTPKTD